MKEYKIPFIVFIIFFIASFFPHFQIILGYLNAALCYSIGQVFPFKMDTILIPFNILNVIIFSTIYYQSKKSSFRVFSAIFLSFFSSSLYFFLGYKFINIPNLHPYILFPIAFITAFLFFILNYTKRNNNKES